MDTHTIAQYILDPDHSGRNVTALSFCAFGIISTLAMTLTGIMRTAGGHYTSAAAYFVLAVLSLALLAYSLYCLHKGTAGSLAKLSYPVAVGGFIFGLTALFFLDGGIFGGVPVFFILAVVATPFFMETKDAIVMVCLEVAAYITNAVFAHYYPGSIDAALSVPGNTFIPMLIVAVTLGVLCMIQTYAYRHQQVKLDSAIAEANSANEAKSSFLNNMSHEIRTPMNSILGMNEMILREEERPEIREYALVIQRSGRALLGIINDVLDFSKLQDKKMEIMPVRYDLSSLINDLVNIAAEQAKKKSLTFTVNVDKEIPRILDGDEYHIRQVMLNILNNAIKYTERGGITVTIAYETIDSYNIMLKCSVTDTGIGIKSEDLENIFVPFEHVEASRKFSADGSGLGLPIVQKLLQLMGSELKIESVFHKGSTFSFEVKQTVIKWEPIGDYERAFSMAAAHQGKAFTQSFQAPDARVLVVDDADVNLLVFANLLKKTKIKIDTASSGLEMLQMVRMNHYNMIFLDHRMPGMDGIEAFHNMKKMTDGLNFNTPVVALTANAVLGARQLYIDEGFNDYISKPVDTVRLEQVLLEYLPPDLVIKGDAMTEDDKPAPSTPEVQEVPAEETQEESSPYRNIPGIDYDAAVTNCGTEDTFVQALEIFYNSLDKKADEIEGFEREKDIKNYTIKVHALKSAARLVGALKLSEDAKYLEACGDKNDIAEIEAKTPALLSDYRKYKPVLAQVFGAKDEPDMSLPEMSPDDLQEMYSLIKGFAADFDLDNIDRLIEETKNYRIPESERGKFEKVKECVTNADWGTLEELL
ncbi:MAG: response regulator [Synergistaceae bacterium]|nr:response regulator [Synergistaceae bacterium]